MRTRVGNRCGQLQHWVGWPASGHRTSEKLVAGMGGMLGIVIVWYASRAMLGADFAPLVLPSLGATAVLVFAVPHSPLTQPWAVIGGHVISAVIGVSCQQLLMHVKWRDCKINILDTPGFDDFIGEVVCSLKVADTALMVLNAAHGVEVGTEILWDYVNDFKTPTIFVISQIDHDKSDFENTLEQAKERFGPKVLGTVSSHQGNGFNSIIDTVRMVMYVFGPNGGKPEKKPIPDAEIAQSYGYAQCAGRSSRRK